MAVSSGVQVRTRVTVSPTKIRPLESGRTSVRTNLRTTTPRLNPALIKPGKTPDGKPPLSSQTPEEVLQSLRTTQAEILKKKKSQEAQPKGIFDGGAAWLQEGAWGLNKGLKALKLPEIKFATIHAGNGSKTAQNEALTESQKEITNLEKAIESAKKNRKPLNAKDFKALTEKAINASDKAQTRVDVAISGRNAWRTATQAVATAAIVSSAVATGGGTLAIGGTTLLAGMGTGTTIAAGLGASTAVGVASNVGLTALNQASSGFKTKEDYTKAAMDGAVNGFGVNAANVIKGAGVTVNLGSKAPKGTFISDSAHHTLTHAKRFLENRSIDMAGNFTWGAMGDMNLQSQAEMDKGKNALAATFTGKDVGSILRSGTVGLVASELGYHSANGAEAVVKPWAKKGVNHLSKFQPQHNQSFNQLTGETLPWYGKSLPFTRKAGGLLARGVSENSFNTAYALAPYYKVPTPWGKGREDF